MPIFTDFLLKVGLASLIELFFRARAEPELWLEINFRASSLKKLEKIGSSRARLASLKSSFHPYSLQVYGTVIYLFVFPVFLWPEGTMGVGFYHFCLSIIKVRKYGTPPIQGYYEQDDNNGIPLAIYAYNTKHNILVCVTEKKCRLRQMVRKKRNR